MEKSIFKNRLVTPELLEKLKNYPLYSQDDKKKDAICVAVFFLGNLRWYILEGNRENNDFTFFGITTGFAQTEYGYLSANEMESIEYDATKYGLGFLKIEELKNFEPCKISSIKDENLQAFLSRLYDK